MPRLLIEYKGIPHIIDHSFLKIDKITYVVVYKTADLNYERKDFQNIDGAFDFDPQSSLKFVFICIESNELNGSTNKFNRCIDFTGEEFFVNDTAQVKNDKFLYAVKFDLKIFDIRKYSFSLNKTIYNFRYLRMTTSTLDEVEIYNYYNPYYEILPRFEDAFLETIFILDIMSKNDLVDSSSKIEAYFMQAKYKIESKNPSMAPSGLSAG